MKNNELIVNGNEIILSKRGMQELKDLRNKIRGDMTDEEWEFFKTIRV